MIKDYWMPNKTGSGRNVNDPARVLGKLWRIRSVKTHYCIERGNYYGKRCNAFAGIIWKLCFQ